MAKTKITDAEIDTLVNILRDVRDDDEYARGRRVLIKLVGESAYLDSSTRVSAARRAAIQAG